jgi:probable phosphoglycerate mutase
MSRIALIRHGPTGWNQQKRLQGQSDQPLSEEGRARVRTWQLPEGMIDDFDWVASPLSRAQETARLLGLDPAPEPKLIEMHWGEWEGFTHTELSEKYGEEFKALAGNGIDLRPHGGESPREVRARFAAWARDVGSSGRPIGAVAHQGIIRAAISLATGWNMINPPPQKLDWDAVHLFIVDSDGTVEIDRLNLSLLADG